METPARGHSALREAVPPGSGGPGGQDRLAVSLRGGPEVTGDAQRHPQDPDQVGNVLTSQHEGEKGLPLHGHHP